MFVMGHLRTFKCYNCFVNLREWDIACSTALNYLLNLGFLSGFQGTSTIGVSAAMILVIL